MTIEAVIELLAEFGGKDKANITAATKLNTIFQSSLARVRLESVLRHKMGVADIRTSQASTVGELCQILGLGSPAASSPDATIQQTLPAQARAATAAVQSGARIGIDIEPIAALPETFDFWEHDFYKSTFSPREIAYALLQPSPRATFAGQWSAKEALRKADPSLLNTPWPQIEVVHSTSGKPEMAIAGIHALGALSISHTDELAIAVFVSVAVPEPTPAPQQPAPPAPAQPRSRMPLLSVLALLVALAALAISWLHR